MPDLAFEHPRLAPLYDVFDADRGDLDVYLAIARLDARATQPGVNVASESE
jgi:hypothetical protein